MVMGNKALSGALVALLLGLAAMAAVPTDSARIGAALASRPVIPMPTAAHFVHRVVIDQIVASASTGGSAFLVVEGGNRAGKSVAVQAAAARLSAGRAVLWSDCINSSTADSVLQRLYGLQRSLAVDYISGLPPARQSQC